jgi:hypothetical protein
VPFGPALKLVSCRNWEEFDLGASRGLADLVVGLLVAALLGQSWWREMVFPPPPWEGRVGAVAACAGRAGTLKQSKSAAGHPASQRLVKSLPKRKYTEVREAWEDPHPDPPPKGEAN